MKSKTIGQTVARLRRPYTKHGGVPPPSSEIGYSLGHGMGQVNVQIDISGCMTARDLLFDSRGGVSFRGQAVR